MYSTKYTVPYTILYTDVISGIDKYTVYLTEHSSVNLLLKCEYNMMYSKNVHSLSNYYYPLPNVYCTEHSTVNWTVGCTMNFTAHPTWFSIQKGI